MRPRTCCAIQAYDSSVQDPRLGTRRSFPTLRKVGRTLDLDGIGEPRYETHPCGAPQSRRTRAGEGRTLHKLSLLVASLWPGQIRTEPSSELELKLKLRSARVVAVLVGPSVVDLDMEYTQLDCWHQQQRC